MWAVGWLRDGLQLWPWAGLRSGLREGSVAVDGLRAGLPCGQPSPRGGPLPTPQPVTKYVIHTNEYIFNVNMYMFSFAYF